MTSLQGIGDSLAVQWLGLSPFTAVGPGFNLWLGNYDPAGCAVRLKEKKEKYVHDDLTSGPSKNLLKFGLVN